MQLKMQDSNPYELKDISIEDIQPFELNPNEETEKEFNELVDAIHALGMTQTITVIPLISENGPQKYRILAGEHRWKAAKINGMAHLPCCVLTGKQYQDEDIQKIICMQGNNIHGTKINYERLNEIIDKLSKRYGENNLQKSLGITEKSVFDKIKKEQAKFMKSLVPKKLHNEITKAIESNPNASADMEKIVQEILQKDAETINKGFIVFSLQGKKHYYIEMNENSSSKMKELTKYCEKHNKNINDLLSIFLTEYVSELKSSSVKMESEEDDQEVPF